MTPQIFPPEMCSRRAFVLASGLFVAGSMVSCTGFDEEIGQTAIQTREKLLLGHVFIRVRIGKHTQKVVIGETTITRYRGKWNGASSSQNNNVEIELKPNTVVTIAGQRKKISGILVLHPRAEVSTRAFDVVAHISLEQYLPGVLAGELFAHWHPSTFAAQAIAARSYAINHHLERKSKSHFDVTDGTASQMFLGDVTLDVAHRAVQETKGIVLSWNDKIIPAYYCACCGGLAATAVDAISSAEQHKIPPLEGHGGQDICTALDIHSWSAKRSARVLRKRLNACATTMNLPSFANIRTIRSIEPTTTNQHGRPTQLVIYGRRHEMTEVRARDFIRAVNAPVPSLPAATEQVWSSFLVGEKNGSKLEIDGFGMGHGVGLCQYGAQELAGKGTSWEDILEWYYPKASISTHI